MVARPGRADRRRIARQQAAVEKPARQCRQEGTPAGSTDARGAAFPASVRRAERPAPLRPDDRVRCADGDQFVIGMPNSLWSAIAASNSGSANAAPRGGGEDARVDDRRAGVDHSRGGAAERVRRGRRQRKSVLPEWPVALAGLPASGDIRASRPASPSAADWVRTTIDPERFGVQQEERVASERR